jgi:hypothetical protein
VKEEEIKLHIQIDEERKEIREEEGDEREVNM